MFSGSIIKFKHPYVIQKTMKCKKNNKYIVKILIYFNFNLGGEYIYLWGLE